MSIKFSKDLRTFADIEEWLVRLDREWPQRRQMAQAIAEQVAALGVARPQVVELASGSGYLAEWLLRALPDLRYTGFDQSPHLLDYARKHLGTLAGHVDREAVLHLRKADLTEADWLDYLREVGLLGKVDAVVSLQSLHDLGSAEEQARAVQRVHQILRPGGLFANADLLLNPEDPHPRRMPAYQHLDLLREAGFDQVNCIRQEGEFGLFTAKSAVSSS